MKEIWQHHAKTDMYKRIASVHSIIGRGSLIPQLTIVAGKHATSGASYSIVMTSFKSARLYLVNVASEV